MAVLGAVDASGRFTPAYAAYTKLTLVNRLKRQLTGQTLPDVKTMSFQDFMTALEDNKAVSKAYARALPLSERRDSQINALQTEMVLLNGKNCRGSKKPINWD
jgi:hypothetical protein